MGVPAFFRWISEKYPRIMTRCLEQHAKAGETVDATQPNPNNYEFDNLYLDMNGLIHPCTHPEGEEAPETEEDMYLVIFRYLDRLFNMIRPRKLIYMAIDGVAPRAKMNQQRSRRFRSAQEAEEAEADADRVRREMINMGYKPPSKKKPAWDSNVITPGTEFMSTLSDWVRHYIVTRLNTNPAFKNVRVILSDAQSPGEGEHKIMQFIRRQRAEAGYDPNTRHCLYGLDADLIMLGLASHEIHFTILREEVLFGKAKKKEGYSQDAVLNNNSNGAGALLDGSADGDELGLVGGKKKKPFDLVRLWILREYLRYEFRPESFYSKLPFEYNFEACIDDFVFICFFVGNDFLPHLPSLSIREGGLELLLDLYKRVLPTVGGYLTTEGKVNLGRVDVFMGVLGTVEDEIFRRRRQTELWDIQRRERNRQTRRLGGHERAAGAAAAHTAQPVGRRTKRKKAEPPEAPDPAQMDMLVPLGRGRKPGAAPPLPAAPALGSDPKKATPAPAIKDNKEAAAALRKQMKTEKDPIAPPPSSSSSSSSSSSLSSKKRPAEAPLDAPKKEMKTESDVQSPSSTLRTKKVKKLVDAIDQIDLSTYEADDSQAAQTRFEQAAKKKERERNIVEDVVDHVRLGEDGWKDRYYVSKFGEEYRDPKSAPRRKIVEAYVTGLCWVMEYYYRGCQSWTWFYEYHYAPFASDLVNIDQIKVKFPPSLPFKPIDQLMGVFPPASAHALPEPCRWFMTDENSPIADFYPRDFKYDPNGKAVRWLWIALLPFIDEERLLKVTRSLEPEFSDRDKERNKYYPDLVFTHNDAPGTAAMISAAKEAAEKQENGEDPKVDGPEAAREGGSGDKEGESTALESTPTTAGDVRGGGKSGSAKVLLSPETNGLSGEFLPPPERFAVRAGERVQPPGNRLDPITDNKAWTFEFRLPKMRAHLSRILPGAHVPPPILSPQELNTRAPRLGRGANIANLLIEQHGHHPNAAQQHRSQHQPHAQAFGRHPPRPFQNQFAQSGLMMPGNGSGHYQQQHHYANAPTWGTLEPRHKPKRHDRGGGPPRGFGGPPPPPLQHYQRGPPPGQHFQRSGYGNPSPQHQRHPPPHQQHQHQHHAHLAHQHQHQPNQQHGRPRSGHFAPHHAPQQHWQPPRGGYPLPAHHHAYPPQQPPPAGNVRAPTSKHDLMDQLSAALNQKRR